MGQVFFLVMKKTSLNDALDSFKNQIQSPGSHLLELCVFFAFLVGSLMLSDCCMFSSSLFVLLLLLAACCFVINYLFVLMLLVAVCCFVMNYLFMFLLLLVVP